RVPGGVAGMLDGAGATGDSCGEAAAARRGLRDVAGAGAGSAERAAERPGDQAVRHAADDESRERVASGRVRQQHLDLGDVGTREIVDSLCAIENPDGGLVAGKELSADGWLAFERDDDFGALREAAEPRPRGVGFALLGRERNR